MSAANRLSEAFERGLEIGIESLNENERELFLIQDFIIGFEMGGLSTYFYNRLPVSGRIEETIAAMRTHQLTKLAALLSRAIALFSNWDALARLETWGELLQHLDPTGQIAQIDKEIDLLNDYNLSESSIT